METKDTAILLSAAAFAANKHSTQRRKDKDASPYINHPIEVAAILAGLGQVDDITVLCAALLHDTIEDTETTAEELKAQFGEKIASVVLEVTDNKQLPKSTRKQLQVEHAPQLSYDARLVKLADKICNLKDTLSCPPQGWSIEQKQAYFNWAEKVISGIRGTHPELEAQFDQLIARYHDLG